VPDLSAVTSNLGITLYYPRNVMVYRLYKLRANSDKWYTSYNVLYLLYYLSMWQHFKYFQSLLWINSKYFKISWIYVYVFVDVFTLPCQAIVFETVATEIITNYFVMNVGNVWMKNNLYNWMKIHDILPKYIEFSTRDSGYVVYSGQYREYFHARLFLVLSR
jgi:hypothetical protein